MTPAGGFTASASPPPEPSPGARWWRAPSTALAAAAVAFLLLHLTTLVVAPDDVDTTNFLLGVRRFSVAEHRPHPPGYPAYIALGKMSRAATRLVAAGPDGALSIRAETGALAIWSAIFGALAVFPLFWFFRALEGRVATAWSAALLTLCWPLYWFTSSRALTDVPGLAVAILAQAWLLDGLDRFRSPGRNGRRAAAAVVGGALVAGLAGGFRVQAVWLALPVFVLVLWRLARRRRLVAAALAAFGGGVALWAVPLVVSAGGLRPYLSALALQAYEDFTFVEMLWTHPQLRVASRALDHTFIQPFGAPWLAVVVLVLALAGALVMLRRAPAGLGWLTASVVPYIVAHLAFHETFTARYPLPLLPALAYLAVRALDAGGAAWRTAGTIALAGLGLSLAWPATAGHAREASPPFRAVAEMRADAERGGGPDAVAMHYSYWLMLRGERLPAPVVETPPRLEWLDVLRYWREGGPGPVWFLANPRRLDLAMFDPRSVHLLRHFAWRHRAAAVGALMEGSRPGDVDWYRLDRPAWMLGEGWSMNPQVRGVARRAGPEQGPVTAWVLRRDADAVLMVGGRHLEPDSGRAATLSAAIEGRTVATWTVPPSAEPFLRTFDLAPGALAGPDGYAEVTVTGEAADRGALPAVALDQFDLRPAGSIVYGFGAGWHELEIDDQTAERWRWTSGRATLVVRGARRNLRLRFSGDSPLDDFDTAPTVVVRAGDRVLARFAAVTDFTESVVVPAEALDASDGVIAIETDRTFVPAERSGSPDRRRLGLRIRELIIR